MNDATTFQKMRRETLATEVRSEIERRILSGDLESGVKLNEVALATALLVSRGTVREAIRSLADSGLIDLVTNRGAFVRRLTITEINNLYDLRGAVFAMGCAAAASHVKDGRAPGLVEALRANLNQMQRVSGADDRGAYYELNIAFHDMILDAAQNRRAKEVYDALVKEMHLFRRRGLSLAMNIARSLEEHTAIVDAVAAGDAGAARAKAIEHIESGLGRFRATLRDEIERSPGAEDAPGAQAGERFG